MEIESQGRVSYVMLVADPRDARDMYLTCYLNSICNQLNLYFYNFIKLLFFDFKIEVTQKKKGK
jgi:hypothetical protein